MPNDYENNTDNDYPATLKYIGLVLNTLGDLMITFGVTLEREQVKQEEADQQVWGQEMNQQMRRMLQETGQLQKKMDNMQRQLNRLQK